MSDSNSRTLIIILIIIIIYSEQVYCHKYRKQMIRIKLKILAIEPNLVMIFNLFIIDIKLSLFISQKLAILL